MVTRRLPNPVRCKANRLRYQAARRGAGCAARASGQPEAQMDGHPRQNPAYGLLRENPAMCRVFLFWGRDRAHHRCITSFGASIAGLPDTEECRRAKRLVEPNPGPAEPPSNQRDVRVELVARKALFGRDALLQLVPLRMRRGPSAALSLLVRSRVRWGSAGTLVYRAKRKRWRGWPCRVDHHQCLATGHAGIFQIRAGDPKWRVGRGDRRRGWPIAGAGAAAPCAARRRRGWRATPPDAARARSPRALRG